MGVSLNAKECIAGLEAIARQTHRKDFRDAAESAKQLLAELTDPVAVATNRLLAREAENGTTRRRCSKCNRERDIAKFRLRRQTLRTGSVCVYRDSHCDSCRWDADKARIIERKERGSPKVARRHIEDDSQSNAAFVGWRGPVSGPLMGARL